MTAAAQALLDVTPAAQRSQLQLAFALEARTDWNYTPRSRTGIAFKAMGTEQRQAAQRLLASALSEPGLLKVRSIIALEIALRELESFGLSRDPENYAIALFGPPDVHPKIWQGQCRRVHLTSPESLTVHIDDEFFARPEDSVRVLDIEILPRALTVQMDLDHRV